MLLASVWGCLVALLLTLLSPGVDHHRQSFGPRYAPRPHARQHGVELDALVPMQMVPTLAVGPPW
jgi:hypothetical protein